MKSQRTIYLISGAACLALAAGLILYPILGNALAEKNRSLVMTEYWTSAVESDKMVSANSRSPIDLHKGGIFLW